MGNTNPVSPLRGWLGGKYRLAGTIIPLIPSDHRRCGMGAVQKAAIQSGGH